MIIAICGSNELISRRRLDELMQKFGDKYGGLALHKIEAEETELQTIMEALQSPPFLAKKKMVVLKNLSQNKPASEAIEQIIYSASDDTDLILYEPSTDKRTSFYKTLKAKTQLEEYQELDISGLANWLLGEAKRLDGAIGLSDAQYLIDRAGADQLKLANEIKKLAAYNPQIDRQSIDLLIEKTPQSKVFDLLDAAFGGAKAQALKLYDEQRAQKIEPQAILAMIAWQLQLIILAKKAGERPAAQIAKDAGMSPYPVQKAQGLARRIDDHRLKKMAGEALRIDLQAKKSPIDMDEAIRNYLIEL